VLVVDPREPEHERSGEGKRILLRLPARRAFGIGSHPSTELVVEALEELPVRGRRVLDVGSGTGILCFVALHLGAHSAVGCECELASALVGAENRRLNRCEPRLFAGRIGALGPGARFDLILLNVLPERIDGELPDLVRRLARDGTLVVSGLLEEERRGLEVRYERLGLRVRARRTRGEWASLLLERGPA
jgi:ribosomal protein L11 methyltransferase